MKRKIKLYSVDRLNYPDRNIMAEVVDTLDLDKMSSKEVKYAVKKSIVTVRDATLGEVIYTIPKVYYEGKIYIVPETSVTVTEDHIRKGAKVVTNPIGEEFLIGSKSSFDKQYKVSDNGYESNDGVNCFRRSVGNYIIKSSWGEQIVLKGSYFCITRPNAVYGITNIAFDNDYEIIEKNKR